MSLAPCCCRLGAFGPVLFVILVLFVTGFVCGGVVVVVLYSWGVAVGVLFVLSGWAVGITAYLMLYVCGSGCIFMCVYTRREV